MGNYCRRLVNRSTTSNSKCCLIQATSSSYSTATEPIPPPSDGSPKQYAPKIEQLVTDISQLTLLEVADLNELLKKTLNIQDAPMMAMGAMPAVAVKGEEEEEDAAPAREKTNFTVKLTKFDAGKKVALIKE